MKKIVLILSLALSFLFAQSLEKDDARYLKRVAPSSQSEILSYHESIKKAKKAVVNIATKKNINNNALQNHPFFKNPFFEEFFGRNFGQMMPNQRPARSLGSGIVISEDGYILTNSHVINEADEITVTFADDDTEYEAKIIGNDPKSDIAVIKIEKGKLDYLVFGDSSKLQEGDVVFAIGNPFGVGSSVTSGIVSALGKKSIGLNEYENYIQTDASINPGNSGGALVDSRGVLIGVNSAILSRGGGNDGIGFAIPSNMAFDIAQSLMEYGKVERGYMGVSITPFTKNVKELYESSFGVLVMDVSDGSSADEAGLQRGDLITQIDGKDVKSPSELKNLVGSKKPGDKIKVTYERNKKILKSTLVLKSYPTSSVGGDFEATNLTNELRQKFKVPANVQGVVVIKVSDETRNDEYGLRIGDVIIQVEDMLVTDMDSFEKAFDKYRGYKKRVYVNRRGAIILLPLK